jgi:hypothetical protein
LILIPFEYRNQPKYAEPKNFKVGRKNHV